MNVNMSWLHKNENAELSHLKYNKFYFIFKGNLQQIE
jgi:hypothetical protein